MYWGECTSECTIGVAVVRESAGELGPERNWGASPLSATTAASVVISSKNGGLRHQHGGVHAGSPKILRQSIQVGAAAQVSPTFIPCASFWLMLEGVVVFVWMPARG